MKGQNLHSFFLNTLLLSALVILLNSCSANQRLTKTLDKEFSYSNTFKNSFTGLAVYDPAENEWIYKYNSEKYFIPASNTKLFTFYTGIKILGDSVPGLRYAIHNDSLIFSGTGDPSLFHRDLPDSKVPGFLKDTQKRLFYLPSNYSEDGLGSGWAWDDYNYSFSAERSAFPISGNTVQFHFSSKDSTPEVYPRLFSDSLSWDSSTTRAFRVKRALEKNVFSLSRPSSTGHFKKYIPFKTSQTLAVKLLEDSLQLKIEILEPSASIKLDKVFHSVPADSLYKQMLQQSDNFIAEQILLLAAQEISDSLKTQIAIDHMTKNFLKALPQQPKWVDGSGLSRYNLQTPENMVKLLEMLLKEVSKERLFLLLPAGGVSGTLKDQYLGQSPYIYAKTGSLSNNYSLSGYLITQKGKLIIFSFMNSNFMVSPGELKKHMQLIIQELRKFK